MNIDFDKIGEQFSNLDPENIGNWPVLVRSLIVLLVCGVVLGAGYYFDTQDQQQELTRVVGEEDGLWSKFEQKQKKAVNLDAYKKQMVEMEESFGTMLRQLPSKNEVADLLVDVTQTGLASGLGFELFKPEREKPKDFYAERPISIRMLGDFHQFGEFVSGVAELPRVVILTMHDISLRVAPAQYAGRLLLEGQAKTDRYIDETEAAEMAAEADSS